MFDKRAVLFTVLCAGVVVVRSQEQATFIKPSDVIDCENKASNEPVNQTLAAEACMRAHFNGLLTFMNATTEDLTFFDEFAQKQFGKKPPPSGYRVRRDIRVLSVTEREKVFRAFDHLYKTGVMARFGRLHGTDTHRKHRGAAFLPWHRVFLTALEEKLREFDPEVSLPYWDYSMDFYLPIPSVSIVWSECFFGEGDGAVKHGPFRFMYGAYNTWIRRDTASESACSARLISKKDIDGLLEFCHFANITTGNKSIHHQNLSHNIERLHDSVHDWVGGDMGSLEAAANDPIFFMHHAFIDYIWEQFRRRQSTLVCQVDAEKDYREPGDYSSHPCEKPQEQVCQGPTDKMQGFEHLQIRDGLWSNWTTAVYGYEPAPKCPECGNSKYLYCNMTIDPRRPEGVCVTQTNLSCVNPSLALYASFDRDDWYDKPLGGGAKLSLGHRLIGVQGDGRTRFMSQEEGLVFLRQQLELDIPTPPRQETTCDTHDTRDTKSIPVLATFSTLLGLLVAILGIYIRKIKKQLKLHTERGTR